MLPGIASVVTWHYRTDHITQSLPCRTSSGKTMYNNINQRPTRTHTQELTYTPGLAICVSVSLLARDCCRSVLASPITHIHTHTHTHTHAPLVVDIRLSAALHQPWDHTFNTPHTHTCHTHKHTHSLIRWLSVSRLPSQRSSVRRLMLTLIDSMHTLSEC